MVGTKRFCIVVTKKKGYTLGHIHSSLTLYILDLSRVKFPSRSLLACSILHAKPRIFVILSPQSIVRKILDGTMRFKSLRVAAGLFAEAAVRR